jgi:hypothetical protein
MNAKLLKFGEGLAHDIAQNGLSVAQPGSGMYLLFGTCPSTQSLNIKFGRAFEKWFHKAVQLGDNEFKMMPGGVWKSINKDLDLIFKDETNKVIYYRELKLNLNLDTEKIVSTYEKVNYISDHLKQTYPEYTVNSAVLAWGTYYKENMGAQSKIKKSHDYDVAVEDPSSFFELVSLKLSQDEYNSYFRKIGAIFNGARQ